MLSISQKKYVNSLKQKKFRTEHNSFIVEGIKMVEELLQSDYEVEVVYATINWMGNNPTTDCIEVSESALCLLAFSGASLLKLRHLFSARREQQNGGTS